MDAGAPADAVDTAGCEPDQPCDDGNPCTSGDRCAAGQCTGDTLTCDDGDPCTSDLCDSAKGCDHPKETGIDCDDGDKCTVGDKCFGGACKPGDAIKCAATGPCQLAACDAATGTCATSDKPDKTACDDGNNCTTAGGCDHGLCAGKTKACDDLNACTSDGCDAATGACTHAAAATAYVPCDDDDKCTHQDSCGAAGNGTCAGVIKAGGCDDAKPCTVDSCDAKTGCQHDVQAKVGQACDDGDACSAGDACDTAGVCKPGKGICACKTDKDCAAKQDGDLCNGTLVCAVKTHNCVIDLATMVTCTVADAMGGCVQPTCDGKTGKCGELAKAAGVACDDGDKCTATETCEKAGCTGKKVTCDDQKACTADSCDPAKGCVHTADDKLGCDDGDKCTTGEACKAGVCITGKPKVCDDAKVCTVDSCTAATGECAAKPAVDGQLCDADSNVCTVKDGCAAGVCKAGALKVCEDGNACTDAACDSTKGCQFKQNAAPCDDANSCTVAEACAGGTCKNGSARSCDDGSACTEDSCAPSKGCVHTPIVGCTDIAKTWTVLVYMAADNNLEPFAIADIEEMLAAKTGAAVRFVVQLDRHDGYSNKGFGGIADFTGTKRLLIQAGKATVIEDLGELSTGAAKTLADFVAWGVKAYKSDRTALVLWNHGHAWQGFGGDEQANHDLLTAAELDTALATSMQQAGVKTLDFIGFDACLMGNLATASIAAKYSRYMIASEDLEPGHGWDYTAFAAIANAPNMPIGKLGEALINAFAAQAHQRGRQSSITLAVLDLQQLPALLEQVAAMTKLLGADLAKVARSIGRGHNRVQRFGRSPNPKKAYHMVDLGDLAKKLNDFEPAVGPIKDKLLTALAKMVLYKVDGKATRNSHGLALYFPPIDAFYRTGYDNVSDVGDWRSTLKGYYTEASKAGVVPKLIHAGDGDGGPSKGGGPLDASGAAGTTKATALPVPWTQRMHCEFDGEGTLIKHPLWTSDTIANMAVEATWSVDFDFLPIRVDGCSLNFNRGVEGYGCEGNAKFEASTLGPWIDATHVKSGHLSLEVEIQGAWDAAAGDKVLVDLSEDGTKWQQVFDVPRLSTDEDLVDRVVVPIDSWVGKRFALRVRFNGACGAKTTDGGVVLSGPHITALHVIDPVNPCKTLGAGAWCYGDVLFACSTAQDVLEKKACPYGCKTVGSAVAECDGKVTGLAGEATVSCVGGGRVRIEAHVDVQTAAHIAGAQLRVGYRATKGWYKGTYVFASVPATIGKDGRIFADWDQNLLVAQHSRGTTLLYSDRIPADPNSKDANDVDHHEVPLVVRTASACPCLEPGDKAYNDLDQDGEPDCEDIDVDGDEYTNDTDNCPWIANPDQKDSDFDGIGDACAKDLDKGKPNYACEPKVFGVERDAVWHVDLHATTLKRVSSALYTQQPYGVSEFVVAQGMRLAPAVWRPKLGDFEVDHQQHIRGAEEPKVRFSYRHIDQLVAYEDGKPALLEDDSPMPLRTYLGLDALYLELRVNNIAGKGDAVIYRGAAPLECLPPPIACTEIGHVADCTGQCVPSKYYGDTICDKGKPDTGHAGANFKCPWLNYDGGDCSPCLTDEQTPDCQGICHNNKVIETFIGDEICHDGRRRYASGAKGPDLLCGRFSQDAADCTWPSGGCGLVDERPDCAGKCISMAKQASQPGDAQTCQQQYNCRLFGFDEWTCDSSGQTCQGGCGEHGKCGDGLCQCAEGWGGYACTIRQGDQSSCTTSKTPYSKHLLVTACVCQIDVTCCTKAWGSQCVKLADSHCFAQCGQ